MTVIRADPFTGSQGDPLGSVWATPILTGATPPVVQIDTLNGDPTGRLGISFNGDDNRAIIPLANPVDLADAEVRILVRTSNDGEGGFMLFLRGEDGTFSQDDVDNGYRIIFQFNDQVRVRQYIGGSSNDIDTTATPISLAENTDYIFVVNITEGTGQTEIRWRIWDAAGADPETWAATITDNDAGRPSSGTIAIGGMRLFGNNSIFGDDFELDDLVSGQNFDAAESDDAGATDSNAYELVADNARVQADGAGAGDTATWQASYGRTATDDAGAGDAPSGGLDIAWEVSTGLMLNARYSVSSFQTDAFYYTRSDDPGVNDWSLTYSEGSYKAGVQGLVMNIRCAQAAFQDETGPYPSGTNPATGTAWDWDDPAQTQANTSAFIAALDEYKAHGVLMVNISMQGGNPGTLGTDPYGETDDGQVISAFNSDGTIKGTTPGENASGYTSVTNGTWADRVQQIIEATREREMVLNLMLFYQRQDQHLADDAAVRNAVVETVKFLVANDARHVVIDLANEADHVGYDRAILQARGATGNPDSNDNTIAGLIMLAKESYATARSTFGLPPADWRAPVGTSLSDQPDFGEDIALASDVAFPHGNLADDTTTGDYNDTAHIIQDWRDAMPVGAEYPIVMNEDDNTNTDPGDGYFGPTNLSGNGAGNSANVRSELHALQDCLDNYASWGLMHKWYMQYWGEPGANDGIDSPDVWKWSSTGDPDVSAGNRDGNYLAAVLDLIEGELAAEAADDFRTQTDDAGATDAALSSAVTFRTEIDGSGAADAGVVDTGQQRVEADDAGAADDGTWTAALDRADSDDGGAADPAAAVVLTARSRSDDAEAVDSGDVAQMVARAGTDEAGATGDVLISQGWGRTESDDAIAADTMIQSATSERDDTDSAGASDDSTFEGAGQATRGQTDQAGASDAAAHLTAAARDQVDVAGAIDSQDVDAAGVLARSHADDAGTLDDVIWVLDVSRDASDSAGTSDSASYELTSANERVAADAAGAADAAAWELVARRAQVDEGGAADRSVILTLYQRGATDDGGASDQGMVGTGVREPIATPLLAALGSNGRTDARISNPRTKVKVT